MSDSTGFILSKEAVNHAYLRLLVPSCIGLAIPPIFGLTSIANMLGTTVLFGVIVVVLYWYTGRYKWVYLSSSGIQGLSPYGSKVLISWGEQVNLKPISAFNGIEGLAMKLENKNLTLFLPLSIASSIEFQSKLEEVAPENHPLRGAG